MGRNKYKLIIITFTVFFIILMFSTVYGIKNENLGNVKISNENITIVNNDNAPKFLGDIRPYDYSPLFHQEKGLEGEKNTIETKDGNQNYSFNTEYFLPMYWKNNAPWNNCQSIVINGDYMYVLVSNPPNEGFIVRYDLKILNKHKINKSGKNIDNLRKLGVKIANKSKLTKKEKELKKAIKVGPVFETGHGQSLSYNPKTKTLWMWQDSIPYTNKLKLMEINMDKLDVKSIYKFSAKLNNTNIKGINNLAFDNEGNFYFDKKNKLPSKADRIFTGKISDNGIDIKLIAIIKQHPGMFAQSLTINPVSNQMYLVSDGAFYTLPLDKLKAGNLNKSDLKYSIFDTKREFEGIGFDNNGTEYLLTLRGSEVLKSTSKVIKIDKFS